MIIFPGAYLTLYNVGLERETGMSREGTALYNIPQKDSFFKNAAHS